MVKKTKMTTLSEENNEIQTEDDDTTALKRKIVEDFRKLNIS